jgi:hypothetical protein
MDTGTPDMNVRLETRRISSDRRSEEGRRLSTLDAQALYTYVRLLYERRDIDRRFSSRRHMDDRRMARA